jgi:hypothetical protein
VLRQIRDNGKRVAEGEQESVAVRIGLRDLLGCDGRASAGAIFHDDRLAPRGRQLERKEPSRRIDRAPGRKRHDKLHLTSRKVSRHGTWRQHRRQSRNNQKLWQVSKERICFHGTSFSSASDAASRHSTAWHKRTIASAGSEAGRLLRPANSD